MKMSQIDTIRWALKDYGQIEGIYKTDKNLIKAVEIQENPFIGALLIAFLAGKRLVLSPDMIYVLILQVVARH